MSLLTSKKNQLYDLIENNDLTPSNFDLKEDKLSTIQNPKYILSVHQSSFYLRFKPFIQEPSFWDVHYSPGEERIEVNVRRIYWSKLLAIVKNWLVYVKREQGLPDKWQRLQTEFENGNIEFFATEDKFTVPEYKDLRKRILMLKKGIAAIPLLPEQLTAINAKLDHLEKIGKSMGKIDWINLFAGSIASLIITLSVSQENGKAIWELIKHAFSNFILNN